MYINLDLTKVYGTQLSAIVACIDDLTRDAEGKRMANFDASGVTYSAEFEKHEEDGATGATYIAIEVSYYDKVRGIMPLGIATLEYAPSTKNGWRVAHIEQV